MDDSRPPTRTAALSRRSGGRWSVLVLACGLGVLGAMLALAKAGGGDGSDRHLGAVAIATGAYVGTLLLLAWRQYPSRPLLALCLVVAVLARVPLVRLPVGGNSDVLRYLWDARLLRAGYNPYAVIPSSPAVEHVHTADTRRMNNPGVPSPYPPTAHLFFRLSTSVVESAAAIKYGIVVADLLTIPLVWAWTVGVGLHPAWTLAYAWHPLVIVEGARNGHLDPVGVFLLMVSANALLRGRGASAALAFALAVTLKFLPIVLAPIYWRRIRVRDAMLAAGVVALLYLPYLDGSGLPLGSVENVVARFRFNSLVFQSVEHVLPPWVAAGFAVSAGLAVAAWFRARHPVRAPEGWGVPLAVTLACSPLVYPWYLVWLVPFLAARSMLPLLAWTLSVPVVYRVWELAGQGHPWSVPPVLLVVQFGPVAVAVAVLLTGRWRGSRGHTAEVHGTR